MATSQAAYAAEKAIGHDKEFLKQDVANYNTEGDESQTMKALVWQGKQKVQVGSSHYVLSQRIRIFLLQKNS
jgi:hypothetical protein